MVWKHGIFDFSIDQVIYFIPRNFGEKLNSFTITVNMSFDSPSFDMELREIGHVKKERGVSEHILKYHRKIEKDDCVKYFFKIDKECINMDNVYYIFIKPRKK
ncbi:hypothetical protein OCV99_11875 [Dorea acetigenes]|uniref:Uncharacterized protein n=1 Tax=Dorea acetigenes TaxID=2981787 RepID=A0ABT2RP86_9FIRM|nr:hypothetical protein [Dorea acetigenes]MCU6687227.1 hypothetical protein [Dorea acetigenes]SCJ32098.1 Uncharacterised protein [uncultured Clostridium sp.]